MRGMRLHTIDLAVFGLYAMVIVSIGIIASRQTRSTKRDYFLAGDKLPWWMVGGSIVAANISSHHFVGVIGAAYKYGFAAVTIEWGAILIGLNALLWIFLPFYLRNGFYTMPEFLEKRFGPTSRAVYACLILATYIFVEVSAVLFLGAVVLNSIFDIPIMTSVVLLALFTGSYTITGGLRAVVWTEMLQLAVLLLGGIVLSCKTVGAIGGWESIMKTSSQWHLLPNAAHEAFPWTQFLGGSLCISVFYCAANQFIVQRALAAKDEWHARMGIVFTDYLKFLTPLIIIVPGLAAPILFPNLAKPDFAFPMLVEHLLPPGLIGLVMAGLIAAIMSHVSGAINSCTTIAAMDLYLPHINRNATDAQTVRFGRIFGIATVLVGTLWAIVLLGHSEKPIFVYLLNAYGYITPGIATMFLLGILWKRATEAGILTAGALTIPLSVAIEKFAPMLPHTYGQYITPFANRTGIVFWMCILMAVVVSLFTRPRDIKDIGHLIWTPSSMSMPKDMKKSMGGLRNPVIWWALVTIPVVLMYIRFH